MPHSGCHAPLYVCLDDFCVTCISDLAWLLGIPVGLLCVDASVLPICEAPGVPGSTVVTQTWALLFGNDWAISPKALLLAVVALQGNIHTGVSPPQLLSFPCILYRRISWWLGSFGISHSQGFNPTLPWELGSMTLFCLELENQYNPLLRAYGDRQIQASDSQITSTIKRKKKQKMRKQVYQSL